MNSLGVISCGHPLTARAAEEVLQEGGNAFDAIVASLFAACVVEPVLASLGGGGFMLAHTGTDKHQIYDFFAQTPIQRRANSEIDFHPITADFGTAQQEFHIGQASIATPGVVRGIFSIHRDLCTLPISRLVEPARDYARYGVEINDLQSYILDIVKPIFSHSEASRSIFSSQKLADKMLQPGELHVQHDLANTLEQLAKEGEALFYHGEIAQAILKQCSEGGNLSAADLRDYQTIKRCPLYVNYRNYQILTNPPPSSGGILVAFALKLLEKLPLNKTEFGSHQHLNLLASAMALTNKARIDACLDQPAHLNEKQLLDPLYLQRYQEEIVGRAQSSRGTTHMTVMDKQGNTASLTVSNGEGCGQIIPGTGIMLNNMLGEEDLNPSGFNRWPLNQRKASMMSTSMVITPEKQIISLGSGGSNRIRTAILQVLSNLIDFGMSLQEAVESPRIHYEKNLLSVEGGFNPTEIDRLLASFPEKKIWQEQNLFFGGVHSVMSDHGEFSGSGDPRRDGMAIVIRKV